MPVCLCLFADIQNDLWARFVTLPNQDRIWTLTLTNKSVRKPTEQGINLHLHSSLPLMFVWKEQLHYYYHVQNGLHNHISLSIM